MVIRRLEMVYMMNDDYSHYCYIIISKNHNEWWNNYYENLRYSCDFSIAR